MGLTEIVPTGSTSLQRPSYTTHQQANAHCLRYIKLLSCAVGVLAALCIAIMGLLTWHITQSVARHDQVITLKEQVSIQAKNLQNDLNVHTENIISLQEESKTCSVVMENLLEELKRHGNDIEELKTKNTNLTAEVKPRDCEDLSALLESAESGIFRIYPTLNFQESGLRVYCDMDTQGGGWIVVQRRQDGSEDFYRVWQEYKQGFGNLTSEFWLGLDNIHALVSDGKWELLINMSDNAAGGKYALYKTFSIGPESEGYVLTVGDFFGDAGDSLTPWHNGMKFTTRDKDNDRYKYNCAVNYTGAWWYKACLQSNLNGVYDIPGNSGIRWVTFSAIYNADFVEMKIKRTIM